MSGASDDMIEGYRDGYAIDAIAPSDNRSASYKHGWQNGRDDRLGRPRSSAAQLRLGAKMAKQDDEATKW